MKPEDRDKYQTEVRRLQAIRGGGNPDEPIRATRLTLSQIVELLLTNRGSREHSSVTLSRNAKGETQIEVVVRTGEDSEIETVDQAAEKCSDLYKTLRGRFPLASGYVGAQSDPKATDGSGQA